MRSRFIEPIALSVGGGLVGFALAASLIWHPAVDRYINEFAQSKDPRV